MLHAPRRYRCALTTFVVLPIASAHANTSEHTASAPPVALEIVESFELTAAEADSIFAQPQTEQVFVQALYSGVRYQGDGTEIAVEDVIGGALDSLMSPSEIAGWLDFMRLGGEIHAVDLESEPAPMLLFTMENDKLSPSSVVIEKQSALAENWYLEALSAFVVGLFWAEDSPTQIIPETNDQPEPSDPAPWDYDSDGTNW